MKSENEGVVNPPEGGIEHEIDALRLRISVTQDHYSCILYNDFYRKSGFKNGLVGVKSPQPENLSPTKESPSAPECLLFSCLVHAPSPSSTTDTRRRHDFNQVRT